MTPEYAKYMIDVLMERLFETETQQYQKDINQLIEENQALLKQSTGGFNYLGVSYGMHGYTYRNSPSLHSSLVPRMSQRLRIQQDVEFGQRMVRLALTKLLQPCLSLQDARDALPECLISLAPGDLPSYPRTRPAAWSIQNNERDLRNYEKALPRIETYCVMKLLY
jgi:hypothetical protein